MATHTLPHGLYYCVVCIFGAPERSARVLDIVEGCVSPVNQKRLHGEHISVLDVWSGKGESMHRGVVLWWNAKRPGAALPGDRTSAVMLNGVALRVATKPAWYHLLLVPPCCGPSIPQRAEDRARNPRSHEVVELPQQPVRPFCLPVGRPLDDVSRDFRVPGVVVQLPPLELVPESRDRVLNLEGKERLVNHTLMHFLNLLVQVLGLLERWTIGLPYGLHAAEVPVDRVVGVVEGLQEELVVPVPPKRPVEAKVGVVDGVANGLEVFQKESLGGASPVEV